MRPKLKDYVFFAPVTDGVLFRSLAGETVLRGTDIYRWVERLVPYFDGKHTVESLVKNLDERKRAMVLALLERLIQAGLVRDGDEDTTTGLSEQEQRLYAASLAHIENHRDQPGRIFSELRQKKIVVAGNGPSFLNAVQALLELGLRILSTWTVSPETTARLRGQVATYQQVDPEISWRPLAAISEGELLTHDMLLYVDGCYASAHALRLFDQTRSAGKAFLHGGLLNNQLLLGPLTQPGCTGCLACAMMRLGVDQAQGGPPKVSGTATTYESLLGYTLAYWLFTHLAGLPGPDKGLGLVSYDLDTLSIEKHRLLPWPACPACTGPGSYESENQQTFSSPEHPPAMQEMQEKIEAITDASTGILSAPTEGTAEQLPVAQASVTVSRRTESDRDPIHLLIPGQTPELARFQAQRAALALYARQRSAGPQPSWQTVAGNLVSQAVFSSYQTLSFPAFATGFSFEEWVGIGLLETARKAAWQSYEVKASQESAFPAQDVRSVAVYIKLLRIRFGLPVRLALLQAPACFPVRPVALFVGEQLVDICVDRDVALAAERGLLRLAQFQSLKVAGATSERQLDFLTALDHGMIHDLFVPSTEWADWTKVTLEHCQLQGWTVLFQQEHVDPALDAIGFFTGYIALAQTDRKNCESDEVSLLYKETTDQRNMVFS